MAGEKTEKATPKKKEDARKKGQVARSQDLQGAVVLLAGVFALGSAGPAAAQRMGDELRFALLQVADPSVVSVEGIGGLLGRAGMAAAMAVLPIAVVCVIAGVVVSVAQVGFKPTPEALKPKMQVLNPISGAKQVFGPNALVEGGKSIIKMVVVGAIVLLYVIPKLPELGGLVGIEPATLGAMLSADIRSIALRAAAAYFVLGLADLIYQRWRLDKSLKMDVQEVRDEFKNTELPVEVRGAIRRRQMQAARARMMAEVPNADVVVTNPTHFAVALKYDGSKQAPEVLAKGQDLVALKIREIAREAGVPIVEDKPLARSLHATCEVGDEIPEDLYQAVAAVLAWVYRTRKVAA